LLAALRAPGIARSLPDVDVAVICGRNRLLRWRLRRLSARYGARLSVHGFVEDMGSWLRAADVVATKAGPATIGESACCGAAMALTGYLPGQERGNVDYVTGAGAGMYWPSVSQLIRGLAWLRADPGSLTSMRASAARLARPYAAHQIAALIADVACAAMTPLPMSER
jgi:1,2-diacylglycerol 3-beta-galactosyltransferase